MNNYFLALVSVLFLSLQSIAQQPTPPPPPAPPVQVSEKPNQSDVVDFPTKEAQFRGGKNGLQKYITKTIEYPVEAINDNAQGKIYLSFIVEKNGEVTNIKVDRGAHPALNKEAVRVVQNMPRWKPGKLNGKKVRTRCRLPIVFTLN